MSTDSTELTFVRCPSCRSLVPAVSTRCRMCGATLDAGVKAEEEQKKPGRVRQRTMSQADSQLSSTASQIRNELDRQEDTISEVDDFDEGMEDFGADDNPLGQYLQEDEEVDGDTMEVSAVAAHDVEPEPVAQEAAAIEPVHVEEQPAPREENKPKVVVESGPRPMGRPSSLSFGKGKEEQQTRPPKQEARPGQNRDRNRQEQRQEQRAEAGGSRGGGTQNQRNEERGGRERDRRQPHQNQRHAQEREHRQNRESEQQPRRESSSPVTDTPMAGRLVGWLVSFDQPLGEAVELREGKFFISGTLLKSTDLVIADKNLSTPHAMVSISASGGVRVQDLMSESGLYIKRRQKNNFQREEGATTLAHGDTVKFGDAEFCVALIELTK
ncbi:MAG: FHA domain-containing protein [Deltaproteobacteria bacterium]|nr:FHA domain-containing protein [Deltaproteobacteria bacterium]